MQVIYSHPSFHGLSADPLRLTKEAPTSARLRLHKGLLAPGSATESATSPAARAARLGRESEDGLAAVYLRLRHVGECESRKDKRKTVRD